MRKSLGWAVAVAALVVVICAGPAAATPAPDKVPLPPDRVAQLAKPATVLVETKLNAKVTMPTPLSSDELVQRLLANDAKFRAAAIRGDVYGAIHRGHELMAERPGDFFGAKKTEPVDETGVGTGFVVGGGGVVLTNSHVVLGDGTSSAIKESFFQDLSSKDIIEEFVDPDVAKQDPALADRAAKAVLGAMKSSTDISDIKRTVTVRRLVASGSESYTATVSRTTSPYPAEDLAVLQVAELGDAPSLSFAAVEPRAGEEAYALGFPGAATFGVGTDERSQLVPSLTKGVVSASKTSEKGVPIIQFDASLAPGNSGGPLLNNHGEVIGINVIGADSPGNFNFAIAGQRAVGYLGEGGVALVPSASTKHLDASVRSLHAGWLKAAREHLVELEKESPKDLALKDLRAELDGRIARKEPDLTPKEATLLVPAAVASALLALATAGTIGSAAAGRRRKRAMPAPGGPGEDLAVWTRPV